jgi:hypothetical protein
MSKDYQKEATDMIELVEELCTSLTNVTHSKWEHCKERESYHDYTIGRKYIRVTSYETKDSEHGSVWGFINVGNKNFPVGSVLKAQGWQTPALNQSRGNLLKGYIVDQTNMYGPHYLR